MALKNGSSGGVDCVDVKYVLAAFEKINQCVLRVIITLSGTEATPVLNLVVEAHLDTSADVGLVPLASHQSMIGSHGPRTMEAAILQSLYSLDAQFAEKEFARADRK